MIRALIVDDQPIVRQGLRMLLSTIRDIEITGEAKDGAEAVQLAVQAQPDLILMDAMMPIRDGISATEILRKQFPDLLIIILSLEGSKVLQEKALLAGAFAFTEKKAGQTALLQEINRAIEVIQSRKD